MGGHDTAQHVGIPIEQAWERLYEGLHALRYELHARPYLESLCQTPIPKETHPILHRISESGCTALRSTAPPVWLQGDLETPTDWRPAPQNEVASVLAVHDAGLRWWLDAAFPVRVIGTGTERRLLPGCLGVTQDGEAVSGGRRIAELVVEEWFWLWSAARTKPPTPEQNEWLLPWEGTALDAVTACRSVLRRSAAYRFLANHSIAHVHEEPADPLDLHESLVGIAAFAYEMFSQLGTGNTFDLLTYWYPGPRRFEKFMHGAGPGQAQ